MFAGDEYALLRAIAGDLPPNLTSQRIAVPPAVMTRLRNSLTRTNETLLSGRDHQAVPNHGAISRRIAEIPTPDQQLILNPNPSIASVLQAADIESNCNQAIAEASAAGHTISRYIAELIAAARYCESDTVWAGNKQNIPKTAQDGGRLLGIQWKAIP